MSETTTGEIYIDLSGDGGVLKRITSEGVGVETPTDGCTVSVHYTSKSMNGEVFESSLHHYVPFEFQLGEGSVIKAFDIGIATMKLCEKCVLICAPDYGYGEEGSGSIPPNATLVFELEMLGWERVELRPDVDSEIKPLILIKTEKKRRRRRQRPYVKIEHDFKWSKNATKLFVEAYKKRKDKFCIPEINQKGLWSEILWEMSAAGYQVDNEAMLACKLRNMKCRFKKLKEKQIRGRGRPIVWEYFNDFEEFLYNDPTFICGLNDTTQCIAAAEESEDDENDGQGEDVFKWTRKATKLFVAMYRKRMNRFRNPTIKKKRLWNEILTEMRTAGFQIDSADALNRKMRAMKKTFKISKDKKSIGRGRVLWEYFDAFREIFDRDPANCDPALNGTASFQDNFIKFTDTPDFVDEDGEESESEENPRDSFIWSGKATKYLVASYKKRKDRFRDPKIKKKHLWSEILHEMSVAGFQVGNEDALDRKLRNMKKTYKTIQNDRSKGLRDRISWEYFDTFQEIFDNDPANCGPASNDTASFNENFQTYTDTAELIKVAEESKVYENSTRNQHDFTWSEKATQFLVASYVKRKDQFRDPRIKKKYLWTEILREMNVAGFQVENEEAVDHKMWRMKNTFKKMKIKKSRGHDRICWEYFDTFEEIFDSDPANCDPSLNDTASFQEDFEAFTDTPEFVEDAGESAGADESELDNNAGKNQHNFKWSGKVTKFFVAAYKKRRHRFRAPETNKKRLWSEILREMSVAGFQVKNEDALDRKLRNMKKTYKQIKESSKSRDRISWKYFDTFEAMFDRTDAEFFEVNCTTSADTTEFGAIAEESELEEDAGENQHNFKWSGKATRFLVAAYRKRRHHFRDPTTKKRRLWSEILREMNAAGFQVENEDALDRKMRNMKKTFKIIKESNKARDRISWEYFDAFVEIFENNPANCDPALNETASFQEDFTTYTDTQYIEVAEESADVEESELEENAGPHNFKWSTKATKFFVAAYKKRRHRFRDRKTIKRRLWSEILCEMNAAGFQVENEDALDRKLRNMKKTYKHIKESRKSRDRISWMYFDTFEEMFDPDRTDAEFFEENCTTSADTPEFIAVAEESELEENAGQNQHNVKWSGEATKFFVAAYKKRMHRFRDPKTKKRRLWSEILCEMSAAGFQVENEDVLDAKMRSMKGTYKKTKDNCSKGFRDRISWEYFDTFQEIFDDNSGSALNDTASFNENFTTYTDPPEFVEVAEESADAEESELEENDPEFFEENCTTFADTPEFVAVAKESELEAYAGENQYNFKWTGEVTKFFVAAYKKRRHHFRDRKTKKKRLWYEILREMSAAGFQVGSTDALDRKMRNMKKTFKIIKESNRGRDRISWEYFDSFVEMFDSDHAVNSDPVSSMKNDESAASCAEATSSTRDKHYTSSLYKMRSKYLTIEERRVQTLAETNRLLAERNDLLRELIQTQQATNSTAASDEANKS